MRRWSIMLPPLPPKYEGIIFLRSFKWGNKIWGCFTWGLLIRSCKWGEKVPQMHFPVIWTLNPKNFSGHSGKHIWKAILTSLKNYGPNYGPLVDPDLGYWYIIWKVNTTNRGLNLKNAFCSLYLWGWEFHVKPVFFFLKILVVTSS